MNQICNPFDFCNVNPSSANIAIKLPDDILVQEIILLIGWA